MTKKIVKNVSFKLTFVFMIYQNLVLFSASQWYLRNSLILSNQHAFADKQWSQPQLARNEWIVSVFPVYILSVYFGSIFFWYTLYYMFYSLWTKERKGHTQFMLNQDRKSQFKWHIFLQFSLSLHNVLNKSCSQKSVSKHCINECCVKRMHAILYTCILLSVPTKEESELKTWWSR